MSHPVVFRTISVLHFPNTTPAFIKAGVVFTRLHVSAHEGRRQAYIQNIEKKGVKGEAFSYVT
jgi:hypothetical protein